MIQLPLYKNIKLSRNSFKLREGCQIDSPPFNSEEHAENMKTKLQKIDKMKKTRRRATRGRRSIRIETRPQSCVFDSPG